MPGPSGAELQEARQSLKHAEQAAGRGDYQSADRLLRQAAEVQEAALGPQHFELAYTFNNLAVVAERLGSYGEAEQFYRRAAAIAAASMPPDDPIVTASRQNLSDFCRARGLPIEVPGPAPATPPANGASGSVSGNHDDSHPLNHFLPESVPVQQVEARPPVQPPPLQHRLGKPPVTDPPAVETPVESIPQRGSWAFTIVAAVSIGVVLGVLVVMRPWRSGGDGRVNDPAPGVTETAPTADPPGPAPNPPSPPSPENARAAVPSAPSPTQDRPAPTARSEERPPANAATSAGTPTLVAAQVCASFSPTGAWRCTAVSGSAKAGPLVLYTRVASPRDSAVVHRWIRDDVVRQTVRLTTRANSKEGYRTYSRQTVNSGTWRVEVRSLGGDLLHEETFNVP